eukprot:Pgem_evm1s2537
MSQNRERREREREGVGEKVCMLWYYKWDCGNMIEHLSPLDGTLPRVATATLQSPKLRVSKNANRYKHFLHYSG